MKIAVVGAGIGGLSAAIGLLRAGFEVDVYEQTPKLGEVGAGLQISSNGARVFNALGVLDEILKTAYFPKGKQVRLWNTGQTWKLFDLGEKSVELYGFPYFTTHRGDLHNALSGAVYALDPNAIKLSHKCVGLEQDGKGVTIHFKDKPDARADIVVGAEGVHSVIREKLFGELPVKFTGIVAWRGVIPMENLPERLRDPVGTNWIGPGGHAIHYPLRRGELMNFTSVVENQDWKIESWMAPSTVEEYLADYPGWHEDVHTYIRAMPQPYRWALLSRRPMQNWTIERITLLGDAAHPMLPFLAQGAVMAIEDGYMLSRALKEIKDPLEALQRYQASRIARATKTVNGAAANTERFHNPVLATPEGAAGYVDREWAPDKVAERYEWMFRYDATTAPI
jgi:salicylate hydroxylase